MEQLWCHAATYLWCSLRDYSTGNRKGDPSGEKTLEQKDMNTELIPLDRRPNCLKAASRGIQVSSILPAMGKNAVQWKAMFSMLFFP